MRLIRAHDIQILAQHGTGDFGPVFMVSVEDDLRQPGQLRCFSYALL